MPEHMHGLVINPDEGTVTMMHEPGRHHLELMSEALDLVAHLGELPISDMRRAVRDVIAKHDNGEVVLPDGVLGVMKAEAHLLRTLNQFVIDYVQTHETKIDPHIAWVRSIIDKYPSYAEAEEAGAITSLELHPLIDHHYPRPLPSELVAFIERIKTTVHETITEMKKGQASDGQAQPDGAADLPGDHDPVVRVGTADPEADRPGLS